MRSIFISIMLFLALPSFASDNVLQDRVINVWEPRNFRVLALADDTVQKVIGSGEFTEVWLEAQSKLLPKPLVIVDLRQEPHGFMNGVPYTWYTENNIENILLPETLIEIKEKLWLKRLKRNFPKKVIMSEKELVESQGIHYLRFPVQDHHPPTINQVQDFISIIKNKYPNHWVYVHCRAGVGRTTFFMTLLDIMKNKEQDSFETILNRQAKIGGKDYLNFYPTRDYKYPLVIERYQLLKQIYNDLS